MNDNYLIEKLNIIKKKIIDINENNLKAFILAGSVSRNEGSIIKIDNDYKVLSDLDIYLVFNNKPSKNSINKIDCLFNDFESEMKKNGYDSPFFHIDYSILLKNKLKNMWLHMRNYELIESGYYFHGDKNNLQFPEINSKNIDFIMSNKFLIERLKKQNDFLDSDYKIEYKKFFTCRNILEIPTIILPNFNVLSCGYENRLNLFKKEKNTMTKLAPDFEFEKIINLLNKALDIKLYPTKKKLEKLKLNNLVDELVYIYFFAYLLLKRKNNYKSPFSYTLFEKIKYKPKKELIKDLIYNLIKEKSNKDLETTFLILLLSFITELSASKESIDFYERTKIKTLKELIEIEK